MASFERTQQGTLGDAVREWKLGRFAPLYAAGVVAGLAFGVAIATWPRGDVEVREHVPPAAFAPPVIDDAPAIVFPDAPLVQPNPAVTIDLPLEWYPQMEPTPAVLETAPEAVAPIVPAPAAPPAPVAAAPIAPAAPAPAVPAPAAPPVQAAPPPPPAAPSDFYVPAVAGGGATGIELSLLQLINQERANAGLAPYVLEAGLTKIARTRSQQLIDQNYFAHRDPFGYSMYVELLKHFGYTSYAWAGENLAMNNWPAETAPNEAIRGLMNSPTHRANILAGDFSRIGVGEVSTADGRHYFTMIFLG